MIKRLNPIIRGWAAYYRTQVSSETFGTLDDYLWQLTYKWAIFSHANKPTSWVVPRYFGKFNKAGKTDGCSATATSGAYMHKFAWTNIVRHQIVKARRPRTTPPWPSTGPNDDARRPCRSTAPPDGSIKAQDGRCPICRARIAARRGPATNPTRVGDLAGDHPQDDLDVTWEDGTSDKAEPRLIHAHCRDGSDPALLPAHEPSGLA